jgi:hypothetical protein
MATYDPARLYALLMNTGLQQKDQPLYQVIHDLIAAAASINTQVNNVIASLAPSSTPVSPTSGAKTIQIISSLDDNSSDDFFSGMVISGNVGATGKQGIQGIQGDDGTDGNDSFIPGPQGAAGIQGIQGVPGLDGDNFDNYPIDFPPSQNFIGVVTDTQNNLVTTTTDGIVIKNDTPSTAGVTVQQSPRLRFRSHVWNTTSLADNTQDWWIENLPASAAVPGGELHVYGSLNGGAPFTVAIFTITNNLWSVNFPGTATSNFNGSLSVLGANILPASNTLITWNNRSRLGSPADGQFNLTNQAATSGIGFDVTTDSTIKIRTRAQTGDGSITALNISTSGTEIDTSFIIAVPVTLGTVVMTAGTQRLIINPAGTLAVLTVTLPATPTNGQLAKVSFTQAITALTFNAPAGATVVAAPTSAAIDTTFRFIYQTSSTSWFPAG